MPPRKAETPRQLESQDQVAEENTRLLESSQDLTSLRVNLNRIDSYSDPVSGVVRVGPEMRERVLKITNDLGQAAGLMKEGGGYTETVKRIIDEAYTEMGRFPNGLQNVFRNLSNTYFEGINQGIKGAQGQAQ